MKSDHLWKAGRACGLAAVVLLGLVGFVPKASAACGDKVIMLATTWCGFCKRAREFFRKNNVPYTEYDVEKMHRYSAADAGKIQQLRSTISTGVPLILIGDAPIRGFSETLLSQALCLSGGKPIGKGSAGLLDQPD
jgi:glutaredoxin